MKKILTLAIAMIISLASFAQTDTFTFHKNLVNPGNCKSYVEVLLFDMMDTSSTPTPLAMAIDSSNLSSSFTFTLTDTIPFSRVYFVSAVLTNDSTCWCPTADSVSGLNGIWAKLIIPTSLVIYDTTVECSIPVSVNETTKPSGLSFYPNPVTNTLYLNLPSETNVIMTSVDGKTIFAKLFNSGNSEINMEAYAPGLYLLNINGKVERIIKN